MKTPSPFTESGDMDRDRELPPNKYYYESHIIENNGLLENIRQLRNANLFII